MLTAVGSFLPAFERPESRFSDYRVVGAPQLVADAACAGTVVLGPPVADFDPDALRELAVSVSSVTGTVTGTGADVLGDPIEALSWLANQLAATGRGLSAGEFVITGAVALVARAEPGRAIARYGELATLEVTLTA